MAEHKPIINEITDAVKNLPSPLAASRRGRGGAKTKRDKAAEAQREFDRQQAFRELNAGQKKAKWSNTVGTAFMADLIAARNWYRIFDALCHSHEFARVMNAYGNQDPGSQSTELQKATRAINTALLQILDTKQSRVCSLALLGDYADISQDPILVKEIAGKMLKEYLESRCNSRERFEYMPGYTAAREYASVEDALDFFDVLCDNLESSLEAKIGKRVVKRITDRRKAAREQKELPPCDFCGYAHGGVMLLLELANGSSDNRCLCNKCFHELMPDEVKNLICKSGKLAVARLVDKL